MLLKRRQPDSSAATLNKFCSIRTIDGVYTEFGIDPTISTIKKLCDGLGISIQDFFDSDLFLNLEQEIK